LTRRARDEQQKVGARAPGKSLRRSRRAARWPLGLGLAALAALAPSSAWAQAQTFYLDRLVIGGAPDDGIGIWRPTMSEKTRFFGQIGLGFSYLPFRIENDVHNPTQAALFGETTGSPVDDQLITYLDVGVEILDRLALQIELPVILYQHANPTNNSTAEVDTSPVGAASTAAMDTRLDARVIVFRNDARNFKLGLNGAIWFPTGDTTSYGGDGSATGSLGLAAEYDFRSAFVVLNTGVHFRPGATVNDFAVTSEWTWGGGVFLPLRGGAARLGAEVFGSVGLGSGSAPNGPDQALTTTAPNLPAEWMAEGRFALDAKRRGWVGIGGGTRLSTGYAPDFRLVGVLGYSFGIFDTAPPSPGRRFRAERFADHGADTDHDGIPDDIDLCPTEPEDHKPPNPDDGCPAPPDRDGDGIPDAVDKCPDQPEDFDGIQDADGCPEDDADHDGIPDAQDACPLEPGEPDPDPKKNGCPKFIRRISGSSEIQILKQVQFATGKATILPNSYPILDEVVRLLKVNLDIVHLDIEGHTDNRGSNDLNEKLSNDRANSVMKYIIDHGIAANRLAAAGFGPKRPIADNNTADGRQKNRRVEFHIRNDQGGGAGEPATGGPVEQPLPPPPPPPPPDGAAPPPAPPSGEAERRAIDRAVKPSNAKPGPTPP
jgi:OmpA-OmpF porin, OOP family